MSLNQRSTHLPDESAQPSVVYQQQKLSSKHVSPTSRELQRFLERKRYKELGHELPMNSKEAASYIGYHQKTVERMAMCGELPAHPASGLSRMTWMFYESELNHWLDENGLGGVPCLVQ